MCGPRSIDRACTLYVDLDSFLFKRTWMLGWNEKELEGLMKRVINSKSSARSMFKNYQTAGMGTSKWHTLDHSASGTRIVGDIEYSNNTHFEHSHCPFKERYRPLLKPGNHHVRMVTKASWQSGKKVFAVEHFQNIIETWAAWSS